MKMYFYYGVMGSSKTAIALMKVFSFEEHGKSVLLLKPSLDVRDGKALLKSRMGLSKEAVVLRYGYGIGSTVNGVGKYDVVIVDESQFLTADQVDELREIADSSTMVMCYGLKTDYMGKLFAGSKRLIELADCIREIPSPCLCGKKAIMNAKYVGNRIIYDGNQLDLGGNEKYVGLCHSCWKKGNVTINDVKRDVFLKLEFA